MSTDPGDAPVPGAADPGAPAPRTPATDAPLPGAPPPSHLDPDAGPSRSQAREDSLRKELIHPGLFLHLRFLRSSEFDETFGTEEQCRRFLFELRWPTGFVCPHCHQRAWTVNRIRRRYVCTSCRKETSLTSGTLFHGTRKPLRTWFHAVLLMIQKGANARVLARELGLTYKVAWTWAHKLRHAMSQDVLAQSVDDAYTAARARVGPPPEPDAPVRERHAYEGAVRFEAGSRGGIHVYDIEMDENDVHCCRRLDRRDWRWPVSIAHDHPEDRVEDPFERAVRLGRRRPPYPETPPDDGLFIRHELAPAYHGGIAERHVLAYVNEITFKLNHRRARRWAFVPVLERAVRTSPHGYRAIVGRRPERPPLGIYLRSLARGRAG